MRLLTLVPILGLAAAGCGRNAASVGASASGLFQSADPQTKALWDTALAAVQTNGFATAILTLKTLQGQTNLTSEQTKAIGDTATAVSDQMYQAANRGDPSGKQAIEDLRRAKGR